MYEYVCYACIRVYIHMYLSVCALLPSEHLDGFHSYSVFNSLSRKQAYQNSAVSTLRAR
jgi:hypothetical protein